MIEVRMKSRPNEWVRYASRKEIADRERWGSVLEVREVEDDSPKSGDVETEKERDSSETPAPPPVELVGEHDKKTKRRSRKTQSSTESDSGGVQE